MKTIKKISAAVISLIISISMLSGCSSKDKESTSSLNTSSLTFSFSEESGQDEPQQTAAEPKLVIDGKETDTEGLVMCTVDGKDIDFDTFRYYYYYTLSYLGSSYGITLDSLRDTEGGFDMLLENVITMIKQDYVFYRFCEDNSLTLDDSDQKEMDDSYNSLLEQAGSEEEFDKMLASEYLTRDVYKKKLEIAAYCMKCEDELFTNGGPYATSEEDFKNIVTDTEKYACARSILIPYSSQAEITDETVKEAYDGYSLGEKYDAKQSAYSALDDEGKEAVKEKSKALAEEVAQKAADGEDFDKLISDYGWDPGMESSPEGYYVTPDTSFVQEYLDALFALGEGEVSALVESDSYGWFIIKRMPIDMDYVEENINDMIMEYDLPSRQQIYSDTLADMQVTYSDTYNSLDIDSIT